MGTDKKLILVADDYDDAAALMALLIELDTPWEAVSAKDGQLALTLARERRPDAAILDVDMPHINGIETARALRAIYSQNPPCLIAVTGGSLEAAVKSSAFDHVFAKPADLGKIVALLKQGLGGDWQGRVFSEP